MERVQKSAGLDRQQAIEQADENTQGTVTPPRPPSRNSPFRSKHRSAKFSARISACCSRVSGVYHGAGSVGGWAGGRTIEIPAYGSGYVP
jgi:hypothetical protein